MRCGSDHHDLSDAAPVPRPGGHADADASIQPSARRVTLKTGARGISRCLVDPLGEILAVGGLPFIHHAMIAHIASGGDAAGNLAVF